MTATTTSEQRVSAASSPTAETTTKSDTKTTDTSTQTQKYLRRISLHPTLTPFRRRVYRALLSVPEGRWTTYSAMATYLNSSARAVGNAMRTNPFAPEVPCHRVLAADRSLGGYKGEWKVSKHLGNGKFRDEKRLRLLDEGVTFDGDGKVDGVCFREFRDLGGR